MAKLYVCKICGEPYIGNSPPDDCPFCGAPKNFIGMADDYSELWGVELTAAEKAAMEETLKLELNATAYYDKVAKREKKYSKYNRLYKQFMRVENEHLDVAAKFLGVEVPALEGEDPKASIEEDLKRTKELEQHATAMYKEFIKTSSSDRVKRFFTALVHAEQGHFDIASEEL